MSDKISGSTPDFIPGSFGHEGSQEVSSESPYAAPSPVKATLRSESLDIYDRFTTQRFSFEGEAMRGEKYTAGAERPMLTPPDEERVKNPQPLTPDAQMAVKGYFADAVLAALKEGHPGSEKINSDFQKIISAVVAGDTRSLSKEEKATVARATEKTRKEFSLSAAWTPDATAATKEAWTPTVAEAALPVSLEPARRQMLYSGATQVVDDLMDGIRVVAEQQGGTKENVYLRLMNAISALKDVISQLRVVDAEKQKEIFDKRQDMAKGSLEAALKQMAELRERMANEAEGAAKGATMEWLGPTIAAVVVVISVLAVVATLGTAAVAVAIAAAVVSSLMLAYSVADSQEHLTQKAAEGIKDLPLYGQIIIGVALAVALIAAIVATGGSASTAAAEVTAEGAAAAGAQVAAQAAKQIAVQLTLQASLMMLMSSGLVADAVIEALCGMGAIDKADEAVVAKVRIAVSITVSLMVVAASAGRTVVQGLKSAATTAADIPAKVVERFQAAYKAAVEACKNGIANAIEESVKAGLQSTKEAFFSLKQTLLDQLEAAGKNFIEGLKYVGGELKGPLRGPGAMQAWGERIQLLRTTVLMSQQTVNVYNAIILGNVAMKLASVSREQGETEKLIGLLEALVEVLEKILQQIQSSGDVYTDWLDDLTAAIDQINLSQKQQVSNIFQA